MFSLPFYWPISRYDVDPYYLAVPPQDVASANFLKRSNAQSALAGKIPVEIANADFDVSDNLDTYLTDEEYEEFMAESYYDTPPPPEPTHVYVGREYARDADGTNIAGGVSRADKATQAATMPLDLPVETGKSVAHAHAHGKHGNPGIGLS